MSYKHIFFHVGLGKTATTYLQYAFFPRLKGIDYVQRTSYKAYPNLIEQSKAEAILVSNEFDRQLETETQRIAARYPDAGIIIVLRRHDGWIASQYRRFIKNGCAWSFREFFDIEYDRGFWKKEELMFYPKLLFLEDLFDRRPLVLFYEDLRSDPFHLFDSIAKFVGAEYDKNTVSLKVRHSSYSEKQLKLIRSLHLYENPPERHPNAMIHFFRRRWRQLVCYTVLYPGAFIPERFVEKDPLIDPRDLEQVREIYTGDWRKCKDYATFDFHM